MFRISVVVNTWNEERNIKKCLESVRQLADEIVVVDMESEDRTVEIAKKFGAKIFSYKYTGYVEPARNFAVSKVFEEWILILDADEELPKNLAERLKKIVKENKIDYLEIPRKNIIFGKWIQHSRWWPDYNIRFFRKGKVRWSDKIHISPMTKGIGERLSEKEELAIIHYNYQSVSQYIDRLNRYSSIQADNLLSGGYKFKWQDLAQMPAEEFLSRFFAGQGYKDGLHGLVLAILQAFSEFVLYLKVWEKKGFPPEKEILLGFNAEIKKSFSDLKFWQKRIAVKEAPFLKKPFLKLKNKIFP